MEMDDWPNGDLGDKYQQYQRNSCQISTGELHIHHAWDPIRVKIPSTDDKGYGNFLHSNGETSPQNLLASPLLQKYQNPTPHRRNLKYNAGQERWPEPPKSGDVSAKNVDRSKRVIVELVNAVTGNRDFLTVDHVRAVREDHSEGQKALEEYNNNKLAETKPGLPKL